MTAVSPSIYSHQSVPCQTKEWLKLDLVLTMQTHRVKGSVRVELAVAVATVHQSSSVLQLLTRALREMLAG